MREKKVKNNRSLLWSAVSGTKRYLVIAMFAVVGAAVANYATPLILGFVTDYVLLGNDPGIPQVLLNLFHLQSREYYLHALWRPALMALAVAGVNALFTYLRGRMTAIAAEQTAKNMRDELYNHLQDVPYDYHKHTSTGDLVQRCSSDVETVRRFIGVQLLEIVRTLVTVLIALFVMLSIDARMTLISTVSLPLLLLVSFLYFTYVKKQFTLSDESEGRLSAFMQENFSGVRVVRAFGQQQDEVERFDSRNVEYRDVTYKLIRYLGYYWGGTDIICCFQILATLVFGVYYAVTGTFTAGNFVIFSTYTSMLVWPVRQLGRVLSDMGKASVSLGRLQEIMDVPVETEPGLALTPEIKGDIAFNEVDFGYDYPDEVLKKISFRVCQGQTIAILGSTGSGKSSLVHLLQRLYPCTGGNITIDGVDVNDIERHHLRRNIGIVLQEPFLYSRTILENIRIVRPDATDEEVYETSRIAAIHDVISAFDQGYDTIVGERGVTLSGGQKQRVAIARMLMQDAPILVFDDSMSALDTETDTMIRDALSLRREGVTTFIISHRVTTLCEADFIIVLDGGRLVQSGTHEELMRQPGIYSRIAGIQTLNVEESDAKGGGR